MVVAGEQQRSAVFPGAGKVSVAKYIAGAVDTRSFSVPDAEDAIYLRLSHHFEDLAAHHGGRGQVFVESRLEHDVVFIQQLARTCELQVVAAERGAFVARNEGTRVETRATVAAHLVHRQAGPGLEFQ